LNRIVPTAFNLNYLAGKQSAAISQQPAANSWDSAAGRHLQTTSSQQPAASSQQSTASSQPANSLQPAASGQQFSFWRHNRRIFDRGVSAAESIESFALQTQPTNPQ
jgi:hypothetical protein